MDIKIKVNQSIEEAFKELLIAYYEVVGHKEALIEQRAKVKQWLRDRIEIRNNPLYANDLQPQIEKSAYELALSVIVMSSDF